MAATSKADGDDFGDQSPTKVAVPSASHNTAPSDALVCQHVHAEVLEEEPLLPLSFFDLDDTSWEWSGRGPLALRRERVKPKSDDHRRE